MSLDAAGRALAAVRRADGAQATVIRERSQFLRYARSRPTQATRVEDITVELTVSQDGQLGSATTNSTSGEALRECARGAEAAAEAAAASASPDALAYPGFPFPRVIPDHAGHDETTAALNPQPGGAALAAAFETAGERGVEAHGIWTTGEVETSIASSMGIGVTDSVTDAFMKVACIAPSGRAGYATQCAVAEGELDPPEIAERAAAKAAADGEPAVLEAGEYPVVFEPAAVGELLAFLGWMTFNGLAYAENRSALCGRLGERVAAPGINLSDAPRFRRTLPRAFDLEGVRKRPLPLIQDGVAHGVVHDTRSAAMAGAKSTGHALAPGGSPYGPMPTNLVLVGGGAADEAELCAPIERGVYVTRLWYTNPVRPKETVVTAGTREGTFLIEDGRVSRPLQDMRITDSILGMLERVEALGRQSILTCDGEFYGRRFASGVVAPAARVGRVRFTD